MSRSTRQFFTRFAVGALLSVLVGLWLSHFEFPGGKLVRASYDVLFLSRPVVSPGEVVLVHMDDDSHRTLAQPYNSSWDRALHGALVERLTADGARAVVFAIVF